MERRTNETPMDFEWQTTGPGDATSPFYQLAMKHRSENGNGKRTYSIFDSPTKQQPPALREPNSKPFLFSQSPATKPATTFPNSSFTTPRKLEPDVDFSSGAETSPENAGGEVTPEPLSTKPSKRNSLFNMYGRFAPSPGRGEIPKSKDFSNVLVNRVHKRRRRDRAIDRHRHRVNEESDQSGADEPPESPSKSRPKQTEERSYPTYRDIPILSTLFTFVEAHPHAPRILSFYTQLAFNTSIVVLGLYLLVAFLLTIWSDIKRESEKASADILAEMTLCAKNFVDNRCGGEDGKRLPALEGVCDNWEKCMNRDPQGVGRAKLSAHAIAEIVNSFVEPISYKTMVFVLITLISLFAVNNWTFSLFRNKSDNPQMHPYMPTHPSQQQHPGSQNPFAANLPGLGYYGPPQGQIYQGFDPQFTRTPSKGSGRHGRQDTDDEGRGYQRQIENIPESPDFRERDHLRTPSSVKKNRMFA